MRWVPREVHVWYAKRRICGRIGTLLVNTNAQAVPLNGTQENSGNRTIFLSMKRTHCFIQRNNQGRGKNSQPSLPWSLWASGSSRLGQQSQWRSPRLASLRPITSEPRHLQTLALKDQFPFVTTCFHIPIQLTISQKLLDIHAQVWSVLTQALKKRLKFLIHLELHPLYKDAENGGSERERKRGDRRAVQEGLTSVSSGLFESGSHSVAQACLDPTVQSRWALPHAEASQC